MAAAAALKAPPAAVEAISAAEVAAVQHGVATSGSGGFGGGGGGAGNGGGATPGSGGFGAGNGGDQNNGGDGGSALGGAIFVRQGGTLTVLDSGHLRQQRHRRPRGLRAGCQRKQRQRRWRRHVPHVGRQHAKSESPPARQTYSDRDQRRRRVDQDRQPARSPLSGTNNYSGTTEVSAGTLLRRRLDRQRHPFTNGTTVDSGATLGGSGTINGNVVNNGNVAPGDPTTLTINGSYTQNSGGNLQIQINNLRATFPA